MKTYYCHWQQYFKRPGMRYNPLVRVLAVRKNTAWIEAKRRNGTIKRCFVKLSRLQEVRS